MTRPPVYKNPTRCESQCVCAGIMHGEVASVIPHTAKGSPMITHSGAEAASEDDAWTIPASRPAGSKSPRLADAAASSAGPNAVDGPIGAASKATAPGCPNGAAQASPSGAADGGDEVDIERFIREERQKRPVPLGLKRAVTKKQKQEEGTWRRAQAMAWIGKYAGDAKVCASPWSRHALDCLNERSSRIFAVGLSSHCHNKTLSGRDVRVGAHIVERRCTTRNQLWFTCNG